MVRSTLAGTLIPTLVYGASIGVEYGFADRHGIGVDFSYMEAWSSHERWDSSSQRYKAGPRNSGITRRITISYRYYGRNVTIFKQEMRPFISSLARIGNRETHPETGYFKRDLNGRLELRQDGRQYAFGLLVGAITPYQIKDLRLEFAMGPLWVDREDTEYWEDLTEKKSTVSNHSGLGWLITVRVAYPLPKPFCIRRNKLK